MRRENKLALIIGFSVLLVVAVLVSDHQSQARRDDVGDGLHLLADLPDEGLLFNTPLSSDERTLEPEWVAQSDPPAQAYPPVQARPAEVQIDQAPRYADASPPIDKSVSAFDRVDEPVVVSNGPAADRMARGSDHASSPAPSTDGGGFFDWDPSRIKELLETVKLKKTQGSQTTARTKNGHIESAGVYVVQPGDTLYEICEKLYGDGDKWHDLAAINNGRVGSNGTVYVGVTLKLLPGAKSSRVKTDDSSRSSVPKSATRRYKIRKGDTLSQIAQRETGSVRNLGRIRELNPWLKKNKDRIMVGQMLVLPARRAG